MTFVHTAAKVQNISENEEQSVKNLLSLVTFCSFRPIFLAICHKLVLFIPKIWKVKTYALPLHSEIFILTESKNEYEHETKNDDRYYFHCSQPVEARYVVGHSPLELV
jgi:hypothetical protein